MDRTHLEVFNTVVDGKSRRVTRLSWDGRRKPIEIFHEMDRVVPFTDDTPLDGHVFIVLLYAASLGKPLAVHGPLSRVGLRHIDELLRVWSRWKRDQYSAIEIQPDRIINGRSNKEDEPTIAAFSGGVDGTFLALQHTAPGVGTQNARLRLKTGLLVHGFDIDMYNLPAFEQLITRIRPLLDYLQLDLRTMRTNSRDLRLQDWDDSCGLELAGCMHMFSDEFQYGLIGSSEPYESLRMPWGTGPITDNLMTGGLMTVIHDGAGYSRTDKVAEILQHPVAMKALKVCWAGMDQAGNCGVCEKCVRTRLNFLAAGATSTPPCFDGDLDVNLIRGVPIDNDIQKAEFETILQYARDHNRTGAWVGLLEERLNAYAPTDPMMLDRRKRGSPLKRAAVGLADAMGVAEPAKKIWRPLRRAFLKRRDARDAAPVSH